MPRYGAAPMSFLWTEQAVYALKRYTSSGMTARQVAAAISAEFGVTITRNAIVGQWNRRGLSNKNTTVKRTDLTPCKNASRNAGAVVAGIKNTIRKNRRNGSYGGLAVKIISRHGDVPPPPPGGEISDLSPETETRQVVALLDLEPHHCRWPVGDPGGPSFGFCGAKRESPLTPYCCDHHERASAGRVRAESLLG